MSGFYLEWSGGQNEREGVLKNGFRMDFLSNSSGICIAKQMALTTMARLSSPREGSETDEIPSKPKIPSNMSDSSSKSEVDAKQMFLFWGCFIALITTAFAFITRTFLINFDNLWPADFGLDKVQAQELFGAGIWPFAISIILFSLVIDKIGYRTTMIFSFVCYTIYAGLALMAHSAVNAPGLEGPALEAARAKGLSLLTWGSIVLGLGNGTVEAFINPVVATMFNREKTKWLNILHAGWPGGLVLGGILTIALGSAAANDWRILIYIIAIPAVIYLVMLIGAKFPVNERVAAGTSYREMLAEFGVIGAFIASFLVTKQLSLVFGWPGWLMWLLIAAQVIGFGVYCKSFGRPLLIFLCLIMMPLATTELGTDGAITGIMEEPMKAAGHHALWVLIYTSAIMMILRFNAGPIVKALQPLGLLAACAFLAVIGLFLLSFAQGLMFIFFAATVYGVAKTFFWPTMLGVVSEQCPKGGALTLNAIAGIGMLTVGIIGGPLIGAMQEASVETALEEKKPGVYETVSTEESYILGDYTALSDAQVASLPEAQANEVREIAKNAKQNALVKVVIFPGIMLLCYLILIFYFKAKGGYKPEDLTAFGQQAPER